MATTTDWAEELQEDYLHESARPIRWGLWALQTIEALQNQNSGEMLGDEYVAGAHAAKMLLQVAEYLDRQYDSGFNHIPLMPLSGFNLSFDRE